MVWSGISTNTIPPVTSFSVETRECGYNGKMESLQKKKKKMELPLFSLHTVHYTGFVKQKDTIRQVISLVLREKILI